MKRFYVICVLGFVGLHQNAMAQVCGCPDPLATNYQASAVCNDGSCVYAAASVAPESSVNLSGTLPETSGLILWNNLLWTHNDNTDIHIYSINPSNGEVVASYPLTGATNTDWEEISQDASYIYVGDFGNNGSGNRTNLKIYKISKSSLLSNAPVIETLHFSYSNQSDFTPAGANQTDFDCEAFIVGADSIYLFTKQWVSRKTSVYSLPKTPGTHTAQLKATFDVQGLITGAVFLENKNLVVLSGYSSTLQPFVYLLFDYSNHEFFDGNKRKLSISLPFHQVEGIATSNGFTYYISNEFFSQPPITTSQKLHLLDLSPFFGRYITNTPEMELQKEIVLYPNPATELVSLKSARNIFPSDYNLLNSSGQILLEGTLTLENPDISLRNLPAGMYLIKMGAENPQTFRVIKR